MSLLVRNKTSEPNFSSLADKLLLLGPDDEITRNFIGVASDFYVPGLISIQLNVDKPEEVTRKSVSQFKMIRNLPTAFCCHNKQCTLPITDPKLLAEEFASKYLLSSIPKK